MLGDGPKQFTITTRVDGKVIREQSIAGRGARAMSAPEKIWLIAPHGFSAHLFDGDAEVLENRGWKRVELRAPEEPKKERYVVKELYRNWHVFDNQTNENVAWFSRDLSAVLAETSAIVACKTLNEQDGRER